MKVHTIVPRYTGEVIFGSSTVPKYQGWGSPSSFEGSFIVPQKDSREYGQLARALKGKQRTVVMVQRFGGREAWDSFEANLALRIP